MALSICSLNSGSNGNCYYIGNKNEAVLVDVGISCREIEKRMFRLGLSIQKIKAIFISHEHTDHIKGVSVLSKKYKLPVFITSATLQNGHLSLNEEFVFTFSPDQTIYIGNLKITAFPKSHDAKEPHSFTVCCDDICVGVFTDIGVVCKNLIHHFKQCHAAFLEANYDDEMLDQGRYPYFLKQRIRGGQGHLSNKQALDLFITHKPEFMSHLLLSHLSKDNNCPNLVHQLFCKHAGTTEVVVASRFVETGVYHIGNGAFQEPEKATAIQCSLF